MYVIYICLTDQSQPGGDQPDLLEMARELASLRVSTFADFKNVLMEGSRKERTVIGKAVVRNSFVLFFSFLFSFFYLKFSISHTVNALQDTALIPFHAATSKPAQKAYLSTLLFVTASLFLLGISSIAYVLFYYNYVPQVGVERVIHLQFGWVLSNILKTIKGDALLKPEAYKSQKRKPIWKSLFPISSSFCSSL